MESEQQHIPVDSANSDRAVINDRMQAKLLRYMPEIDFGPDWDWPVLPPQADTVETTESTLAAINEPITNPRRRLGSRVLEHLVQNVRGVLGKSTE